MVMVYRGVSRVRAGLVAHENAVHPLGRFIGTLWGKIRFTLNYIAHGSAVIFSKIWARISFSVSKIYRKIVNKLEEYFKHKNESNINKEAKTQSILLTTIKAYKREIKKLNRKIEDDKIGPKEETDLK